MLPVRSWKWFNEKQCRNEQKHTSLDDIMECPKRIGNTENNTGMNIKKHILGNYIESLK
jgi:hypothetical protein